MAMRRVSDAGLKLAHDLVGAELAAPSRRFGAFAIDAAIVLLPSLLVALAAAWAVLSIREPRALDALVDLVTARADAPAAARAAMRQVMPLLVRYDMPGTPPEAIVAYRRGDLDGAVDALGDADIVVVLNVQDGAGSAPPAGTIRLELGRLLPAGLRFLALYGVAGLYFTWLTSRRSGATLGKRMLGIRVVRVDEHRVGLFASLERFFGYAQVPASFFTALTDLWRDPNRRLPHDRLAGTLVVRAPRRVEVED